MLKNNHEHRYMDAGNNKIEERSLKYFLRLLWVLCICTMTLLGLSVNANAQVGMNNQFCPGVAITEGMLVLEIVGTATSSVPATFSGAMLGTMHHADGNNSGGLDWMTKKETTVREVTPAPTNEIGSQLITWWSRKYGRNTQFQITNHDGELRSGSSEELSVHVHIYDSNCVEIRDFCDTFTPLDTHLYDLSNLVTNTGNPIYSTSLADKEGFVIVTPVVECIGPREQAIAHNFLSGNVYMSDPLGLTYGTNMIARRAICTTGCSGTLDGTRGAKFDTIAPVRTYGLFNTLSAPSGSDAVVINFHDSYGPPYRSLASNSQYFVSILNNNELLYSCGDIEACFLRLGVDSILPARQDLGAPFTGP